MLDSFTMSDQLYRDEFMSIFKSGANYGKMVDPSTSAEEVNKFCGDKITLELKIANDIVADAKYTGLSCAVSKVSSSLVTEYAKGKSLTHLKGLTEADIFAIIGFDLTENRKQCALVCFNALKKALHKVNNDYDQRN